MADKAISELVAAEQITATDVFVLEQNNTAKKVTGQILLNWLTAAADGHGGISSIVKQSTNGLTDTYRIMLADTTTFDFTVTNGKSITSIAKQSSSGLVDTYKISYNDDTSTTFTVTNGSKGDKGDAGNVWIKYASQEPTPGSHSMSDIPDDWMGVYSGNAATAPTDYTQYKWFRVKGERGETGASPTVSAERVIGGVEITVTPAESSQPSSSVVVHDGADGANGKNGMDGCSIIPTDTESADAEVGSEFRFPKESVHLPDGQEDARYGDMLLTPDGKIFRVLEMVVSVVSGSTDVVYYTGELVADLKGETGANGLSLYYVTEEPYYSGNNYIAQVRAIVSNGRVLMPGDMLLAPSGKVFAVESVGTAWATITYITSLKGPAGSGSGSGTPLYRTTLDPDTGAGIGIFEFTDIISNGNTPALKDLLLTPKNKLYQIIDVYGTTAEAQHLITLQDAVPAPQSAKVGQIIAVKTVDAFGAPTSWEPVDPWVITSSVGSKHRICVNYDGSLYTEMVQDRE